METHSYSRKSLNYDIILNDKTKGLLKRTKQNLENNNTNVLVIKTQIIYQRIKLVDHKLIFKGEFLVSYYTQYY